MTPRLLLAVDLDGTLISGNTLHLYIRCAMTGMLRHGRLGAFAFCAGTLGLRRLGLISHKQMKFRIFSRIRPDSRLNDRFTTAAARLRNRQVGELIAVYRSRGYAVLLASAAPVQYIPLLWEGDFVATDMNPASNPSKTECRGEEKLRRVLDFAAGHGLTLAAAISDDAHDDAPLLNAVREAYLVSDGNILRINPPSDAR